MLDWASAHMYEILSAAIPLLPLLAAFWIALGFIFGWNRLEAGEKQTSRAAVWAISVSFLLILLLDILVLVKGSPGTVQLLEWLHSERYHINISFLLDGKSLTIGTLAGFITLIVTRFSVNYLHREAGFQRFFKNRTVCMYRRNMENQ